MAAVRLPKETEMILKFRALFEAFSRLIDGRSYHAWVVAAARLEREALLEKLATTEDGLLDREAEDRVKFCRKSAKGLKATVLRRGRRSAVPKAVAADFGVHISPDAPQLREIPANELVPGDLVELKSGDTVPADVRLLSCKDFLLDQSALTGDHAPVRKYAGMGEGKTLHDFPNIALAGTKVVSGSALGVAIMGGPVERRTVKFQAESVSHSAYGSLVPQR